jgi:hypothetical protein
VNGFGVAFVLASFFPYLSPIPISTDLQPVSLLLGALALVTAGRQRINSNFGLIAITFYGFATLVSMFEITFGEISFNAIRGPLVYLSFAFHIIVFSVLDLHRRGKFVSRVCDFAIVCYLLIAFFQYIGIGDFLRFILNAENTGIAGGGRGANSLTAEPTFFALTLILIYLIKSEFDPPPTKRTVAGIILSGSASGGLSFAIIYSIFSVKKVRLKYVVRAFLILLCAIVLVVVAAKFAPNSRIGNLSARLIELRIDKLLIKDASINDRLGSLVVSVSSIVEGNPLPKGFSSWASYVTAYDGVFSEKFPYITTGNGRIHSSIGALIYEMGFLGLVFGAYLFRVLFRKSKHIAFVVAILLAQSVPWAHPLLAFIVYLSMQKCNEMGTKYYRPYGA